jgi:hypothetical protein
VNPLKNIKINMTTPQLEKLVRLSEKSGLSYSEIIRRAFDYFVVSPRRQRSIGA